MISLFILSMTHLGHKAVEWGIINLDYCFGDNLLTMLDHHWSCNDLIWSNTYFLILNTYLNLLKFDFLMMWMKYLIWWHSSWSPPIDIITISSGILRNEEFICIIYYLQYVILEYYSYVLSIEFKKISGIIGK